MNTNTRTRSAQLAALVAVVVIIGGTWMSPPPASAQLGNLIVTITSPTNGSTVSGTITVSATVSTVGSLTVQSVQFKLDGVNLGAADTTAPYAVSWDTRTATNATHTLTAVAKDTLGVEHTSDAVTVTVFNDKTPPTIAITAPGRDAPVDGTVTVTASASDNVGVVGVRFLVDGTQIGVEDTAAPYSVAWDTTGLSDGPHTLTAVARDAAGNTATSAAVTVRVSQTATRFEDTDPSILYTDGKTMPGQPGGWWHGSRSRGWSGRTASFNRSEGARATFSFTGTTVRWIGFRAPWAGIARVYVDGTFVQELDLYWPTELVQTVAYSASGLTPGVTHTLIVESTGRKNDSSVDYAVVVDAFDVLPASVLASIGTRFEETAVSLAGTWTAADTSKTWSGGAAAVSATAGAQATFGFVGTEVRWLGMRGPRHGIARVFLDGSFHATVDTYSPTESEGIVFTATNLAPAAHTLTIEVTGDRNAAATDSRIAVDAIDVRARFEEVHPAISYTPDWIHNNDAKAWSGTSTSFGTGLAALSRTAGARTTFTFTGTGVSWISMRGPGNGIARVAVDGGAPVDVDTYAATEQLRAVVFSTTNLADGPHTLTVEVTGQRNAASIDSLVFIDAFDITPSPNVPAVTRVQELAPSVVFTGNWTQGNTFDLWTGEHADFSMTTGARATFTFTGTAVRWIGQRAFDGGIARVFLDGAQVTDVDTFAPLQEEYQAVMFAAAGLAPGQHTLDIEVTGQSTPGSQGAMVVVDGFDVE